MLGIYTMMLVVFVAGIILWGSLIFFLNGLNPRALWLLLAGLPLSALVNVLAERPLMHSVANRTGMSLVIGGHTQGWFILFLLLLPPMLEEPVKLLPLLLPGVRRMVVSGHSAIWVGLALGVSFGLGEAAFLAYGIATSAANAALPASVFTNYAIQRWIACLLHGVMTAVFLIGIQRGRWRTLTGYLSAVALHILVDSPALLTQIGILPGSIAQVTFLVDFGLAVLLLVWLWRRNVPRSGRVNLPTNPQNVS